MNKNRNLFVFVMVCCSVFGASRIVAMEEEVEDLFRARQALDRELANPKSDLNTRIATTILCMRARCPGIGADQMLPVEVGEAIINEREKDLLRFQESRRRFAKAFSKPEVQTRKYELLRPQLRLILEEEYGLLQHWWLMMENPDSASNWLVMEGYKKLDAFLRHVGPEFRFQTCYMEELMGHQQTLRNRTDKYTIRLAFGVIGISLFQCVAQHIFAIF